MGILPKDFPPHSLILEARLMGLFTEKINAFLVHHQSDFNSSPFRKEFFWGRKEIGDNMQFANGLITIVFFHKFSFLFANTVPVY
jgi:hypothetical protein